MSTNPWLERRIINYAHQGGSHEAPSSTLLAIEQALANGAGAIELDVHATKDRRLVVCHDETVDRTTNATGAIADLTLEEVQNLDNAHWFIAGEDVSPGHDEAEYLLRGQAPADRALGIVTLEEVITTFPGVLINLDIKKTAPDVEPYEALLAEELRRLGRAEDTIVASFNDTALESFRNLSPETPTSAATMEVVRWFQALLTGAALPILPIVAFQVPEEVLGNQLVDENFIAAAHAEGIAVHVWTINDVAAMARLIELGVDGVMTDRPSDLAAVLGEKSWKGV